MGAGASALNTAREVNADLAKFLDHFAVFANKAQAFSRKQSWIACDPNGNGYVSLAEFDGWIKKSLELDDAVDGERLWKRFRPSYIRAFNDAKDISKERKIEGVKEGTTTDDYITKGEFRLAVAYLCIYATMFDAFALIDGNSEGTTATDDRRMSADEWKASYTAQNLKQYGFAAFKTAFEDPSDEKCAAIFAEMDADKKGMVLLIEFCKFIENAEIKAGTEIGKLLNTDHETKEKEAAAAAAADGAADAAAADAGGAKE